MTVDVLTTHVFGGKSRESLKTHGIIAAMSAHNKRAFGDRVRWWITFNEPWEAALLAHGLGIFPPNKKDIQSAPYKVAYVMLLAHAKAWHTYDQEFRPMQQGNLSIILNTNWGASKTDSQADRDAADRYMEWWLGWFAHPVFVNGDWPEVMKTTVMKHSEAKGIPNRLPEFTEEEKSFIKGTGDFFALNMYTTSIIEHKEFPPEVDWNYLTDRKLEESVDPSWQKGNFVFSSSSYSCSVYHFNGHSFAAGHNMLLAHAKAWHTYDKEFRKVQKGKVSIVVNGQWYEPKSTKEEDIQAADRGMQWFLGWMAHPVFIGDYPEVMKSRIKEKSEAVGITSRLPSFTEEERDFVKGTADFLALNYYSVSYAEHHDLSKDKEITWGYLTDQEMKTSRDPTWLKGAPSWLYCVPWGMRKILVWLKEQYNDPEIIITENGFSVSGEDDLPLPAALNDQDRVTYLRGYINEALKAVKLDGVKLKGYFVWSLLDNFEWDDGFRYRFGIHHVNFDHPDRPRYVKQSAKIYKEIVKNNGFP
ncbi:PREDICTED: lactase-phlorizin hydrolase-like [Acropora digitifera]|uniref:lactase-phlorizin hydrolase-like n=1 Tax=Acropora digitifera TaxID=70779 RepID=UPI00077A89D6|nr:PREDICTED: lactase-phlorizin hydrolase-like [Acropora digitifera]